MSENTQLSGATVGSLVAGNPAHARIFESLGIDYCCGGKRTLRDACAARGHDLDQVVALLREHAPRANDRRSALSDMSLVALVDDIERTHHAFVRRELPRLDRLTGRVLTAHGERDPRLQEVRRVFLTMMVELESHLEKEEQVLFPIIRELEATGGSTVAPDSLEDPLKQLELEHQDAGSDLAFLRAATDEFTPPEGACSTWIVMLDSLKAFERDMHEHVHKENNVLFPRALDLERQLHGRAITSEPA